MDDFEIDLNGVKNAQFFLTTRLVYEAAKTKGPDAENWLEEFRRSVLSDVDGARQENPLNEGSPQTLEIADATRAMINASCDVARHKLSKG